MSAGIQGLSDTDLMRMLGQSSAPPPTPTATPTKAPGVTDLSDADLMKALGMPHGDPAPIRQAAPGPQTATDLAFGGEDAPAGTSSRDTPLGRVTGAPETAYAAASGALDGIPIVGPALTGASNRLAAGTRSLRSGDPYATELKRIEDYDAAAREAHPVATKAGEVVGAIGGTAPLVIAAPAAFGAGSAALPVRAGLSAVTGGFMGGADTAARGGDAKQIEHGALIGGFLGGAAPALGAAAGKVAGAVAGRVAGAGGDAKLLNRALTADGFTPETASQQLAAFGDAGMIADLGPNLQRQAGALAATPGEAQQVVRGAIADRTAGASGRTTEAANRALGQPTDAMSTMQRLIQERADAAAPAYLDAYIQPMPENGRVRAALSTPAGQTAWQRASVLAENEGIALDLSRPTVRSIDLTKRALDDMVSSAQRAGNNNEARVLGGVRNLLVSGVDAAVPQYAAARQTFASHAALQDAFEAGQSLFEKGLNPGQVNRMMRGMTEGERQLMQEGARSALADLMGGARNDALKARQVFDQGYNREKLAQVIGREQADTLISDLGNEAAFARTRDVVTGNSETAARAAAMGEIQGGGGDPAKAGVIKNLLDLNFGSAAAGAAKAVTRGFGDTLRERRNADLAQILMETGPDRDSARRAFAALGRSVRAKDITSDTAQKLMNAAVRGGGQQALGGFAGLPAR